MIDEGELPKWFIGKIGVRDGVICTESVDIVARKTIVTRRRRPHLHFLRNMSPQPYSNKILADW
jgi:hypothetical protein